MGTLYRRGSVWWLKYWADGKPYRESSGEKTKRKALKKLKVREGEIAKGNFDGLRAEKTTFEELAEDLINDYLLNGYSAIHRVREYVRKLKKYFGGMKATHITADRVRAYRLTRKAEATQYKRPPANATINRELAALKRMFSLGIENEKVLRSPKICTLKEDNTRKGFFEHGDYLQIKKLLPRYLVPLLTLGFYTGMRKGEILSLRWEQVDLGNRLIRLEAGTTKNDEARVVPISRELYQELIAQKQFRDENFPFTQHVFFNHSTGKPIKNFREAWNTARTKAGLPNALFHDLRRTGVRNLVRAGVSEKVAMAISGHKTRSVFDRYNIVNEDDVRGAGEAVDSYLSSRTKEIKSKVVEIEAGRSQEPDVTGTIRAQSTQLSDCEDEEKSA